MKNKKGLIIAIILLIIFISIIAITIIFNTIDKNKLINSELQKHFDTIADNDYGLIDLENTDNVKIKNNEKVNISPKIKETHTFKQYEISNMEIFTMRDTCFVIFDIENLSYTGDEQQTIEFFFYDQKGKSRGSITYELFKNFTVGKKTTIKIVHHLDFSNSYDYKMTTYYE